MHQVFYVHFVLHLVNIFFYFFIHKAVANPQRKRNILFVEVQVLLTNSVNKNAVGVLKHVYKLLTWKHKKETKCTNFIPAIFLLQCCHIYSFFPFIPLVHIIFKIIQRLRIFKLFCGFLLRLLAKKKKKKLYFASSSSKMGGEKT